MRYTRLTASRDLAMIHLMAVSFFNGGRAYPGGKGKSYQHVINVMAPHHRYVESHLGAGSVMRFKRPARVNIGIDRDERVVERWKCQRFDNLDVHCGDALTIVPSLGLGPGDLLYCDPPFHPATRRKPRAYRHELSAGDHERLLEMLSGLECSVVLSGYVNELYEERLSTWHRTDFETRTHVGAVTESIWTNYRPGPVLHDYSFIGGCFRERERMRRRVGALSAKLRHASELERNAALALLADIDPRSISHAAERVQ